MAELLRFYGIAPTGRSSFVCNGVNVQVVAPLHFAFTIPGGPPLSVKMGDFDDMLGVPKRLTINGQNASKIMTQVRRNMTTSYKVIGCHLDTRFKNAQYGGVDLSEQVEGRAEVLKQIDKNYNERMRVRYEPLSESQANTIDLLLEQLDKSILDPESRAQLMYQFNETQPDMRLAVATHLAWQLKKLTVERDMLLEATDLTAKTLQDSAYANDQALSGLQIKNSQLNLEIRTQAEDKATLNRVIDELRDSLALSKDHGDLNTRRVVGADQTGKVAIQTVTNLKSQVWIRNVIIMILSIVCLILVTTSVSTSFAWKTMNLKPNAESGIFSGAKSFVTVPYQVATSAVSNAAYYGSQAALNAASYATNLKVVDKDAYHRDQVDLKETRKERDEQRDFIKTIISEMGTLEQKYSSTQQELNSAEQQLSDEAVKRQEMQSWYNGEKPQPSWLQGHWKVMANPKTVKNFFTGTGGGRRSSVHRLKRSKKRSIVRRKLPSMRRSRTRNRSKRLSRVISRSRSGFRPRTTT